MSRAPGVYRNSRVSDSPQGHGVDFADGQSFIHLLARSAFCTPTSRIMLWTESRRCRGFNANLVWMTQRVIEPFKKVRAAFPPRPSCLQAYRLGEFRMRTSQCMLVWSSFHQRTRTLGRLPTTCQLRSRPEQSAMNVPEVMHSPASLPGCSLVLLFLELYQLPRSYSSFLG